MRKIFVLDTNVLIHDPYCIKNFRGNDVIVPIFVIEEIDTLKRNPHTAIQARLASRVIDKIREKGSLFHGVLIENDIFFRVEIENDSSLLPENLNKNLIDNHILTTTLVIQKNNPDKKVIIVSKDINMRIKADSLSLHVEDYITDRIEFSTFYTGCINLNVSEKDINIFQKTGSLDISELNISELNISESNISESNININSLTPNSFFKLNYYGRVLSGRYHNGKIKKILLGDANVWGLRARNEEQRYAIELLMDDNIKVITLIGGAGTGKTIIAIATALEQVVERKNYKKVLIARPIIPMGKDLGYLPGTENEKMRPWMQPIFDNIDFLAGQKESKSGEKIIHGLEAMGFIKIEPLTYIRGRSISSGFIVIDEAQNLTPLEIKTIVTRVGDNAKIVFTGDPTQIDNPYLDANTNGLTYLSEKLKNVDFFGHVTLVKGERSEVSEVASKLL